MIYLSNMSDIFLGTLAGLMVTILTGWFGIKLAVRLRLMDIPGALPRKQHQSPTPYAGGIALFLSLLVLMIASGLWNSSELRGLFLAVLVTFIFGIWDDYKKLRPAVKLCGQILAAILLIYSGIYVRLFEGTTFFFGGPHEYIWVDWAVTLLWIVGVTNAFNLVDSMDGLAVGLSAWAFAFFMLAMLDSQQRVLSEMSAMVLGICLGLLFYNTTPARLFLGDAGAQSLGLLLASIAILYTPQVPYQKSSWFVPILLVGVPIFDTVLVTFSRLRRRKAVYLGGMDHTYHRLVALGFEPGRAVLAMHMAALMLECAAFVALALAPGEANGIFAGCLLVGLVCMFYLDNPKRWP